MVIMGKHTTLLHFALLTSLLLLLPGIAAAEGDLDITIKDENDTAVDDAKVTINDGSFEDVDYTDSSGQATFSGLDAATYRITIEKDDFHTREVSVTVEDETETTKTVFIEKKDLRGTVRIHTETEAGDDLPGVNVRLVSDETGYDKERTTSSSGYIIFSDVPVGEYEAYLERSSFRSRQISITVRDGKTTEHGVIMREGELNGRALQITSLTLPSSVRPGDSVTAEVDVKNNLNETARGVRIEVGAFNQNKETARFSLVPNETKTRTLTVEVPLDTTEDEEIRVTARDYENSHTLRTMIRLTSYRASMQLEPETVTVGNSIYVSGRITDQEGSARDVTANLYLNDEFIAGLTTDETGRYNTYIRPETPGIHRVTLQNSNLRVAKTVRAQPRIGITQLNSPTEVNQTEAAEACAQIQATTEAYVTGTLVFNGRHVASNTTQMSEGQICLPLPTEAPGEYSFTFRAHTRDGQDTEQSTVTVLPQDEVDNPGIILNANTTVSMDKGQKRYITGNLLNPTQKQHNVSVHVRNLPPQLTPLTNQSITLPSNSTHDINFTIDGNRSGSYIGTLDIDYKNTTVLSQEITVDVRGSVQAFIDSVFNQLKEYSSQAVAFVRSNIAYVAAAVLITAVLLLIGRRLGLRDKPSSLEPKNE